MAKIRGLGRGLDALLAGQDAPVQTDGAVTSLPTDSLRPGIYQPRSEMDSESISELAKSIKSQGIVQPLIVRPIANDKYEIIAGERRWRAARSIDLGNVPVVIRDVDNNSALAMALIENIQREDLNVIDEAVGIKRLTEEFQLTQEAVSKILGKSRSAIANIQRLLNLSESVQKLLREKKLDMGHARALLGLDRHRQNDIAKQIVGLGLSVRETETFVASKKFRTPKKARTIPADRDTVNIENDLSDKLGLAVKIQHKKNGAGRVALSYSNLDELDIIVRKLSR